MQQARPCARVREVAENGWLNRRAGNRSLSLALAQCPAIPIPPSPRAWPDSEDLGAVAQGLRFLLGEDASAGGAGGEGVDGRSITTAPIWHTVPQPEAQTHAATVRLDCF
jgi:hypothetical protein